MLEVAPDTRAILNHCCICSPPSKKVLVQAAAKHEQAAAGYSHSLQQQSSQVGSLGTDAKAFLVDRCCEAYAAVADWQGLQQWLQDMKVNQLPLTAALV